MKVLMLGLGASGKTQILYKLKTGNTVDTTVTIGFNFQEITWDDKKLTLWDIGGSEYVRYLWCHHYSNNQGLIFVVDSDSERNLDEDCEVLHNVLRVEELKGVNLLVFANKQDLPTAMNSYQVADKLRLNEITDRKWLVQASSGINGEGLLIGLNWLYNMYKENEKVEENNLD